MPTPVALVPPDRRTGGATRGLTSVWKLRGPGGGDAPPLVQRVLAARGLLDAGAAADFLTPSLRHLHDPSLMPGLDRAAARILHAARAGEAIVIYGDYDVDGITASTILYRMILTLAPAARVTTYVPHRLDEGYGINTDAVRKLAQDGARVIVSVDCGITAIEPARAAREAGADLIITDHHNTPGEGLPLPDAYACVHPRLPGSAYPFGDLCGAGVAFKLAWRLATLSCGTDRVPEPLRALLLDLLALAALGVIADVVPLRGENRVIAKFGLARVKQAAIPGLKALIAASGLAGAEISAEDVGFKLAPRLNACGRLGHAREAVELLTSADTARCRAIADELTRLNDRRRATEKGIFEHAAELAQSRGMTRPDRRAIVLAHPEWHQGVVGIVCSRLIERFHRPTILFQDHGEECHGSGRSIDGFALHDALGACAGHLLSFGGHDMAAGLRCRTPDLDAFTDAFTRLCNDRLGPDDLVATTAYDCDARLHELTAAAVAQLHSLAPFGRDNPAVRVRLTGARVVGSPETFGAYNKHLSVRVGADGPGPVVRLVGWNWAPHLSEIRGGGRIDAIVEPKISTWGGTSRVECELRDLRVTAHA